MEHEKRLILPISVVSRVDLGRLVRELGDIDDFLKQAAIRTPGTSVKLPRTSKLLDDIISVNQMNVLLKQDRVLLQDFLISVRAKAPLLHMSFSADPSPLFTQKLMTWLRKEIHPLVLLQVGLQPNLGAGCILRTANKQFDFSLRSAFRGQRPLLMRKIAGILEDDPTPVVAPAQSEVAP